VCVLCAHKFFVILCICNISEITVFLIKFVFIVGFRNFNKIDKYVRVQKDQTEHTQKNNVVYIFLSVSDTAGINEFERDRTSKMKRAPDVQLKLLRQK